MPFSDDEVLPEVKHSPFTWPTLYTAWILFFISLFTSCCYTGETNVHSFLALLTGWLVLFTKAGIAWLANPLLLLSWILMIKAKKNAWVFALAAFLLSADFLTVDNILINEAGGEAPITGLGPGYWLWLSSCFVTLCGSIVHSRWLIVHSRSHND